MQVQYHTKAHPIIEEVCYPGHNSRVTWTTRVMPTCQLGTYICTYACIYKHLGKIPIRKSKPQRHVCNFYSLLHVCVTYLSIPVERELRENNLVLSCLTIYTDRTR